MRDLDNAILNLKGYINLERNSSEAYYDLGIYLKEKELVEEAIKYFSLAIQKKPTYASAYFERGLLKHKQNDKEGGCADLKKALESGHPEASDYLDELCEGTN
jgi:tetratricopeptide (TPR) repeat protein